MKEPGFKFTVAGRNAEETARDLADFIEKEFEHKTESTPTDPPQEQKRVRSFDPLSAAAFVVALPSAVLGALELLERMKKKEKVDKLLQWLQDKHVQITITAPDGTTINMDTAKSSDFLGAPDS
ncbi:MAG: hypothetical protein L0Y73_07655 [Candidatus Aminicenantes bacterium]|nr:hypothetical protein [Candidatus Aminicenantes bacterium]